MKLINLALSVTAGLAGLIVTAGAAFAVPAEARIAVNVRTGPAITYTRVDTLSAGELVDVVECDGGWCYVDQDGPNGWVSATYLQAPSSGPAAPSNPDCTFEFTIGPGGPSLSLVCDGPAAPPPPPPPPPPGPEPTLACFFTGSNYTGTQFCLGVATLNSLGGTFNDNISSVRLTGGARARLCVDNNLGGFCRNIFASEAGFGAALENNASSLQVFTGAPPGPPAPPPPPPPPPPPGPVTFSTGPIALPQTFSANLDNGNIGSGGQADIWYQAENAVSKFITPRNGARLSVSGSSNRGFAGCSTATFSSNRVSIWTLPVGTYVCVRTNQGRISEFRLNGYTGTTMNLGYTTWQ